MWDPTWVFSIGTCYMHASATSIEVTALCNVHRFCLVLLKLGKIKIAKYSSMIFCPILCVCKVHSFFRKHCSSCNIDFPSIATNNIASNMNPYNSSRYTHTMWSLQPGKKSRSVRKCMVHITNRCWSVQPLHLVVLTRFPR